MPSDTEESIWDKLNMGQQFTFQILLLKHIYDAMKYQVKQVTEHLPVRW